MTQVTRTINQLIDSAYRLLGEVGADEVVTGTETSEALYVLNELLDQFSAGGVYIPYNQQVTFNFTAGKGTYSFSDVVSADVTVSRIVGISYANYFVQVDSSQPISYPLYIINKSQYYNIVRLSTLKTRPGFVFLDRQITESFLTFYPIPDQPYQCTMGLKLMIPSFALNQPITNVPPYAQRFLRYALTRELKSWYPSGKWSEQDEEEYTRCFNDFKESNELDMTIRPTQILVSPRPFYWPNIIAY
jgi:hypothetical protein